MAPTSMKLAGNVTEPWERLSQYTTKIPTPIEIGFTKFYHRFTKLSKDLEFMASNRRVRIELVRFREE
jgi:hypothetical protein